MSPLEGLPLHQAAPEAANVFKDMPPVFCRPLAKPPATCDTNTYDPEEARVREARGQEARVKAVEIQEAHVAARKRPDSQVQKATCRFRVGIKKEPSWSTLCLRIGL